MSANAGQFGVPQLPPEGLQRFLRPQPPKPRPGERCEMCLEPIPPHGAFGHGHVVNLEGRSVMCACRPCYLLFEPKGASQGKFRAVPDRHLHDPAFALTEGQWDALQVPVRMAFFFQNTIEDRVVAFYPSPAGATESLLALDTWQDVMDANPAFKDMAPDVEAILVYRDRGANEGFEAFLVPITVCYELVGHVRLRWKGFDGGQEAWDEINGFFQALRDRSERVGKEFEDGDGHG